MKAPRSYLSSYSTTYYVRCRIMPTREEPTLYEECSTTERFKIKLSTYFNKVPRRMFYNLSSKICGIGIGKRLSDHISYRSLVKYTFLLSRAGRYRLPSIEDL